MVRRWDDDGATVEAGEVTVGVMVVHREADGQRREELELR